MAKKIYTIKEETLIDIADAIREKIGSSEKISPLEMANIIKDFSIGISEVEDGIYLNNEKLEAGIWTPWDQYYSYGILVKEQDDIAQRGILDEYGCVQYQGIIDGNGRYHTSGAIDEEGNYEHFYILEKDLPATYIKSLNEGIQQGFGVLDRDGNYYPYGRISQSGVFEGI